MKKAIFITAVLTIIAMVAAINGCGGGQPPAESTIATNTGGTGTGITGPLNCGNSVVDSGEICDDGNSVQITAGVDVCQQCNYYLRESSNALMQRDCKYDMDSISAGNGDELAAASCGTVSAVRAASMFDFTDPSAYDYPAATALTQAYLTATGVSIQDYIATGANYNSLCNLINATPSLGISCSVETPSSGQEQAWMLQQIVSGNVVILNLKPYKNSVGQIVAQEGHYIIVHGYMDGMGWPFLVTDVAGIGTDILSDIQGPYQSANTDLDMLMTDAEKHFLLISPTAD